MRWMGLLVLGVAVGALGQQQSTGQQTTQPPAATEEAAKTPVSTMTTAASAPELTMPASELTEKQVEGMQKRLADWPQLARYREDDAKLGEPAKGEQRVVFLGDSITDGWGRIHGSFFPGKPYVNRGISGQTTPQMVLRMQQDVIALHPAAVVILAGINDIAGNTGPESLDGIEANFRTMVSLAKAQHIRVVLSSVLPASYFPWRKGVDPTAEVVALNQWLQGYATKEGLVYLNYYPALVDNVGGMRPELASDKAVHPNDAGYAVMMPLAEAAVEKALAEARP